MPKITALIHTYNDARRIGRAVESLRSCDEVLVVDHGSTDNTQEVARSHGATVKEGVLGVDHGVYAVDARHDWILCLLPSESLTDHLEASLYEWKQQEEVEGAGFSLAIREQLEDGAWTVLPAEVRLVNRKRLNWTNDVPSHSDAPLLSGELLRLRDP